MESTYLPFVLKIYEFLVQGGPTGSFRIINSRHHRFITLLIRFYFLSDVLLCECVCFQTSSTYSTDVCVDEFRIPNAGITRKSYSIILFRLRSYFFFFSVFPSNNSCDLLTNTNEKCSIRPVLMTIFSRPYENC